MCVSVCVCVCVYVVNITLEPSGGDQDMGCSVTVVKRSEEFGNLQLKELPRLFHLVLNLALGMSSGPFA